MHIIPVNNSIMNSVTYVLTSEEADFCVLVDCGEYEPLKPVLDSLGKKVKTVLLTHGHSDHIFGLPDLLKAQPGVEIATMGCGHDELKNPRKNLSFYHGTPFTVEDYREMCVKDGDMLHFEGLADIEVIAAPGHDESCLCYRTGKDLFTGDAYIPGLRVFTKFPGADRAQAEASIEKLSNMEKNGCIVHCGHHDYQNLTR